jgi:hypothetical protein
VRAGTIGVGFTATAARRCLWAFFRQREDFPYPCATRLSLAGYPSMERCASLNCRFL